jgi:rubrerythrin
MIPYLASDDPSTRPLIEGLLDTEEKHANDLSDLIAELRS